MRILYFYQYFTTPKGAWSTRAYEFARRWVEAGDQVTVVTSVYDKSDLKASGLISTQMIDGIEVIIIGVPLSNRHGFALRLITFLAYALLSCWFALTRPADVVVSSSGPITSSLPGLLARYLRGIPWVFEVRDLWPDGAIELGILRSGVLIRLSRWLERTCYRSARRLIAVSDGMASLIRRRAPQAVLDVVPNAADNELIASLEQGNHLPAWTHGRKLVVYAGTLGVANACGQILQMAGFLQDWGVDSAQIVLIGDGRERGALEAETSRLGLRNVHFAGLLPREHVLHWLRSSYCSLLVLRNTPVIATGSPNKLFDSLAAGAPVLQNTSDWMKDLLARENCGVTVPPDNPEALAAAVRELVQDQPRRDAMAANALRVAREQFDRGLLAGRMRRILQEAAQT